MTARDIFAEPARVLKSAAISACGQYRYWLVRQWDPMRGPLRFVILNPSTADDSEDDPTIRRCIGFAKREGRGGIVVANIFAMRSTNPAILRAVPDPIGPDNNRHLRVLGQDAAREGAPIVCAWGANAPNDRWTDVAVDLEMKCRAKLVCLGKTKDGAPRHPLYVRADKPFEPFP